MRPDTLLPALVVTASGAFSSQLAFRNTQAAHIYQYPGQPPNALRRHWRSDLTGSNGVTTSQE